MKKVFKAFALVGLVVALSGCSTFQRMDEDKVFDDLLTTMATGAVGWAMSTYLTPQAESVGAVDAIDWLAQQRNRANYHPEGLEIEYRRRSRNAVLDEILVRYRSALALHDVAPSAKHIDSLIRGIRMAVDRS